MPSQAKSERVIAFGPFRLLPNQRVLLDGDTPLRLGSRAFAILTALAERSGETVSKTELMSVAWPNTHVEDDNLKVHISVLRRALGGGGGYIASVSGRGYAFVAPVTFETVAPTPQPADHKHNLPIQLTRLIGRTETVENLARQLVDHRMLTIIGAGGIGKTSVALSLAEASFGKYPHGVWLADLAPVRDPALLPSVLATVLGFESLGDDPLPGLIKMLRDREIMIVLDNCEHVVQGAARLAAEIMRGAPRVQFLATSREPLRVENEHLCRLASLDFPASSESLSSSDLRAFPAVQLLIERATASSAEIEIKDADIPVLAEICCSLDGIPLAIEFVAPYVSVLGARGLAARLGDRLNLFSSRRHGVLDRHQTLRATHEWSYALLDDAERIVLRRLSVFAGRFTLESATDVATCDGIAAAGVVDCIASLVVKSLVSADVDGAHAKYRLFDTTRAYAFEKLQEHSELAALAARHASHFADVLDRAWADSGKTFEDGGYPALMGHLGDVRTALQWCFSSEGDAALGVRLTAGAGVMFIELGLVAEAREWTGRALPLVEDSLRNTRCDLMLLFARGHSLAVTRGNSEEAISTLRRVIELATALDDRFLQMRILAGYHIVLARTAEFKAAMAIAIHASEVAKRTPDPMAIAVADAMLCHSYHYAGDQAKAEAYGQSVLTRAPPEKAINTIRFGLDQRVRVLEVSGRVLWLTGRPAQAATSARNLLDFALRLNDPIAIVMASYAASIVALLSGDWDWARQTIPVLGDTGRKYDIQVQPDLAAAFEAELLFRTDGAEASLADQEATFDRVRATRWNTSYHAIGLIEALISAGRHEDAKRLIDRSVAELEQEEQFLFMPEYRRLDGDILAANDGTFSTEAEAAYQSAIDLAREQSAVAWELRASLGLARLYRERDPRRAQSLLLPVYERYTEGLDTADLVAARQLLDNLSLAAG